MAFVSTGQDSSGCSDLIGPLINSWTSSGERDDRRSTVVTPQEVTSLVEREISEYVYRPPDFQPIGTLWSTERVQEEIAKLRESLVEPRLIRVVNRDAYDNHYECDCWIVAYADDYCVVFDPDLSEFMLAAGSPGDLPETVAVSGHLPDVFMAR